MRQNKIKIQKSETSPKKRLIHLVSFSLSLSRSHPRKFFLILTTARLTRFRKSVPNAYLIIESTQSPSYIDMVLYMRHTHECDYAQPKRRDSVIYVWIMGPIYTLLLFNFIIFVWLYLLSVCCFFSLHLLLWSLFILAWKTKTPCVCECVWRCCGISCEPNRENK